MLLGGEDEAPNGEVGAIHGGVVEGVDEDVEGAVWEWACNAVAMGLAACAESVGGCEVGVIGNCVCGGHGEDAVDCCRVEKCCEVGHAPIGGHIFLCRRFGNGGFVDLDVVAGNATLPAAGGEVGNAEVVVEARAQAGDIGDLAAGDGQGVEADAGLANVGIDNVAEREGEVAGEFDCERRGGGESVALGAWRLVAFCVGKVRGFNGQGGGCATVGRTRPFDQVRERFTVASWRGLM